MSNKSVKKEISENKSPHHHLLSKWFLRAHLLIDCHHTCSVKLQKRHFLLGVPSIVLSVIVGATVFLMPERIIQIVVGIAGVSTAILVALQTFLDYSQRSVKHKMAGDKYGEVMRELEQALFLPPEQENLNLFISTIRNKIDMLNLLSPTLLKGVWDEKNGGKQK